MGWSVEEVAVRRVCAALLSEWRRGEWMTTATAHHGGRYGQIVECAAGLFEEFGYHSTSMDDIAAAVGIAKPSLYHYFTSKSAILFAIHEELISVLLVRQATRDADGLTDLEHRVHAVMFDVLELMVTHRGHVRTFFEHHRELAPDARVVALAARDQYFQSVQDIFTHGAASGEMEGDARLSALALFGMCNWAYQWFDQAGPLTTEDIATSFTKTLLDGVRSRTS